MKKLILFLVFMFLFSVGLYNVNAVTGSVSIKCNSTTLKVGESTKCSLTGTSDTK